MKAYIDEIGQTTGNIEVNIELPAGDYKWSIEDTMGNRQQKEITIADGEKQFIIQSTDLPDAWLNRYRGSFKLSILDGNNNQIPFYVKSKVDRILFDVRGNEIADNKLGETI